MGLAMEERRVLILKLFETSKQLIDNICKKALRIRFFFMIQSHLGHSVLFILNAYTRIILVRTKETVQNVAYNTPAVNLTSMLIGLQTRLLEF